MNYLSYILEFLILVGICASIYLYFELLFIAFTSPTEDEAKNPWWETFRRKRLNWAFVYLLISVAVTLFLQFLDKLLF